MSQATNETGIIVLEQAIRCHFSIVRPLMDFQKQHQLRQPDSPLPPLVRENAEQMGRSYDGSGYYLFPLSWLTEQEKVFFEGARTNAARVSLVECVIFVSANMKKHVVCAMSC